MLLPASAPCLDAWANPLLHLLTGLAHDDMYCLVCRLRRLTHQYPAAAWCRSPVHLAATSGAASAHLQAAPLVRCPAAAARVAWMSARPTAAVAAAGAGPGAAAAQPLRLVLVVGVALVDVQGRHGGSAAEPRVLLAQRPQGKANAGLWEFPGGKVCTHHARHRPDIAWNACCRLPAHWQLRHPPLTDPSYP